MDYSVCITNLWIKFIYYHYVSYNLYNGEVHNVIIRQWRSDLSSFGPSLKSPYFVVLLFMLLFIVYIFNICVKYFVRFSKTETDSF